MNNILKLINTLGKQLGEEITLRQLSKESNVPYTTTHRIVSENKDLFLITKKANIKLCSIDMKNEIIQSYLIISEDQCLKEFVEKKPMYSVLFKDLPKGKYSLILFGSRAEGKEREKSDVDICIISDDNKIKVDFSKFELLFKLEINPMYFSKEEFISMAKEKEHNLFDEIIKKHIIFYGEKYFWEVAANGF